MPYQILIADDEPQMISFMQTFLIQEGYDVITATTGTEALQLATVKKPDLVILDWMMPEMSGIEVCRELRKTTRLGIIMVTAKNDEVDKIIGLEVGADDYITKPFSLRELAARIRSLLRRMFDDTASYPNNEELIRGDLVISESQYRVWKHGTEISLTPTQFKLLLTLAARPGIVFSRLQLLQSALEDDYLNDERTVDAHISQLRKKIEDQPSAPKYIQTVYGFGYRFSVDDSNGEQS